jgi:hypothetical protein
MNVQSIAFFEGEQAVDAWYVKWSSLFHDTF